MHVYDKMLLLKQYLIIYCKHFQFLCRLGDQNGFRPKSLKVCSAELRNICKSLLNEPEMKHNLSEGSGGPPPEILWLLGSQMVHSSAILSQCIPIPLPRPPQNLFSLDLH